MKKFLSKVLSVIVVASMVLPARGEVFAAGKINFKADVTNNAGMPDTVKVTGLLVGDIVNVYSNSSSSPTLKSYANKGEGIGKATAKLDKGAKGEKGSTKASAIVSAQFPVISNGVFSEEQPGYILVTVTRKGLTESLPLIVDYPIETRTPTPAVANVTVANNAGMADTVTLTDLKVGDIVKVYANSAVVAEEASESVAPMVTTTGETSIINQLNSEMTNADKKLNYVNAFSNNYYKTATINFKNAIDAATAHSKLINDIYAITDITVINDKLTLINLPLHQNHRISKMQFGQTPENYQNQIASAGLSILAKATTDFEGEFLKAPIGTATANATKKVKGATATPGATATVSIPDLGSKGVSIFITVTNKGSLESFKSSEINSVAEIQHPLPNSMVTIVNNAGLPDTVTVEGLDLGVGDIVSVYKGTIDNYQFIQKATAKANKKVKGSTATPGATATVSIPQLGGDGGTITITVTRKALVESKHSNPIYFKGEGQTQPPSPLN